MVTLNQLRHRALVALALTSSLAFSLALNSGGTIFGMACYLAAPLCFIVGVWAIWASRQPQNSESGYVARGVAALFLCGLFVTGGAWTNRPILSFDVAASILYGYGLSMFTVK